MKEKNSNIHYLEADYRSDSLHQIIEGLVNAIKLLEDRVDKNDWYDVIWFREDSEPIFGLAFIAFQNYINGSIKDLMNSSSEKTKYYKLEPKIEMHEKTYIELIIGLANYIKHKDDDGDLHRGTANILKSFNLVISKNTDIVDSSPIFDGLSILSENWDLFEIESKVKIWRASMLKEINKQHCT